MIKKLSIAAILVCTLTASASDYNHVEKKVDTSFRFGKGGIYHKGWTDLNKNGKKDVYEDSTAPVEERVADLLSQMTLDEKTCQMVTLYGYRRILKDDLPTQEWKEKLWKDGIGAIDEHLNSFKNWGLPLTTETYLWPASTHAWAMNTVQQFFIEQTRLGIPVDFTNEGIRGVEAYIATNFPTQLGMGCTWDTDLVREEGRITGREARLLGYTNVYAPILDVIRDQRWGRCEESYGEDPFLVASMGTAMASGLQKDFQVAATAKHYCIYSNNKGAREGMARLDPQVSPHEVENIHMYPWREVIAKAGLMGVMSSYNDYDGEPVQGSRYWLTDRLRKDFGFCGYVVSDSDAVEYLHSKHHVTPDMKGSVKKAVEAGLNIRCTFRSPDSYVLPLRELVQSGELPMSTIDERVADILRVKFKLGLFDHPYQTDYKAADREVNCKEHNETALRASLESLVLLKNDGLLPLDAGKIERVAVIGPNADETGFVHTHYGPQATEAVSVLQGIRNLVSPLPHAPEVVYAKGSELVDSGWPSSELFGYEPSEEDVRLADEAVRVAQSSDVAVLVLGGSQRTCGENKTRSSLDLPPCQEYLLKRVCGTGKPVAVVLICGRPLSINRADRDANSILCAWYPGTHGGTAVAKALFGQYNPGGKLSVTFPRTVGQLPFNFPYKPNSQVDGSKGLGPEGNATRASGGALYNFGHGLSYTTFEYSDISLSSNSLYPNDSLTVTFKVRNTGSRPGDEVVQLYIHDRVSSITVYERMLRGFKRIHLSEGESATVSMVLHPSDFEMLDKDMKRVIEPGEFDILVGSSSTDIRLTAKVTQLSPAAVPAREVRQSISACGSKTVSLVCPDAKGWNFRTALKDDGNGKEYVTVHMDRSVADIPPKFELIVDMPQTNICNFWSAANDHPVLEASWKGSYSSQIASGIPVYEFFDANCVNRLTMALDEPFRLVNLKSGAHEEGSRAVSRFQFFTMPEAPLDSYEVTLLLDSRPVFWAETIKDASGWISSSKGLEPCNVPKEAFQPLYSSWYQFHQEVSAAEIEAEAALAAKAGMKVIIVDDGWQTDDNHRGYAFCGDWQVSPGKFPDMRAHVKKVQDMGLKYMLWYSVPFVGYNSRNYDRFRGKYLYDIDNLKASVLDPRFPEVREFLVEVYETALRDWGLDGFKLDFIDRFFINGKDPAVAENYAGRDMKSVPDAVDLMMKAIVDRLRSINPDILIEFRQKYIGPAIRQYGNMFRAGDCPGNATTNRIRTANLRLTSGSTAVHADMLEWNNAETPEAAARNIISSIFSVVQYSVMLRTLPQSHMDMVRNWMAFSVEHSRTLLEGEFRPYHPEAGYPLIEASSEIETILGVYADNIVVPVPGGKDTYILNATGSECMAVDLSSPALSAVVTDACGRVQAVKAPRKGLSRVRIPDGGFMKLVFPDTK